MFTQPMDLKLVDTVVTNKSLLLLTCTRVGSGWVHLNSPFELHIPSKDSYMSHTLNRTMHDDNFASNCAEFVLALSLRKSGSW